MARRLKRALVVACGRTVDVEGEEILLFPTPEMVREATPAVCEAIEHERKAKTILAAADAFATEDLSAMDDGAFCDRLEEIWRFGEWSSEFISLRGFGRLSGIPRTEQRLREAVAELSELHTAEAGDSDLDRLNSPYEPLEGYWVHYIRIWVFRTSLTAQIQASNRDNDEWWVIRVVPRTDVVAGRWTHLSNVCSMTRSTFALVRFRPEIPGASN